MLSPTIHICVHSAHATFDGVPLPQCSLLWRQTWWDKCAWRTSSGDTINDIHDHPREKQSGIKMDTGLILMQDPPSTWNGSEQWEITHHQYACWRLKCQMPIWGNRSGLWILL